MDKTIGLIGGGNMGSAILGGILHVGLAKPEQLIVADVMQSVLDQLQAEYGCMTTTDNQKLAEQADILFLAVKPNLYSLVLEQIRGSLKEQAVIVTIAAGQTIMRIQQSLAGEDGRQVKVVRVMPNTPALVGAGMAGICPADNVTAEELEEIKAIFGSFGECEIVRESMMDAVTGISGSSPAYVYMFIEAMADAGVAAGLPRASAYHFAAQAVYGSAKMMLETGKHPGALKDMVCSPGGTTIEAVSVLEQSGFRGAVIKATQACIKKSEEMTK